MRRIRRDILLVVVLLGAIYVAALYGLGGRPGLRAGAPQAFSPGQYQWIGSGLVFQHKATYSSGNRTMIRVVAVCRPAGASTARALGAMPRGALYMYGVPHLSAFLHLVWGFSHGTAPPPPLFGIPPGTCVTVRIISPTSSPPRPSRS